MMSEAHSNQLLYLILFIIVLVLAIAIPMTLSVLRKKTKPQAHDTQNANTVLSQNSEENTAITADLKKVSEVVTEKPEEEVRLSKVLAKTEESFFGRIRSAFSKSDMNAVLDDIEEVLYTSDLGPKTVGRLLEKVKNELSKSEISDIDKVKSALKDEMQDILTPLHAEQKNIQHVSNLIQKNKTGPTVIMIVGVNGAGKTTSIGKITAQLAEQKNKVLVAAGDTFRAAAGGQLKVWTERAQNQASDAGLVEIFWPENTNDPAAIAFDAVSKAQAKGFDYVIIDTAGRLHTQNHLMDELKKVKRVMSKVMPDAPHETWIVLDANSGQNALNQAVEFNKALEISGIILTKMDGTAKGGVALGVVHQLNKPIRLIGVGERIQDLRVFDSEDYVKSILGI